MSALQRYPETVPHTGGWDGALLAKGTKGGEWSNTVKAQSASAIGLVVKGFSGQTADLQEWQNSGGSVLAKFNSSGNLTLRHATPEITLDDTVTAFSIYVGATEFTVEDETASELRLRIATSGAFIIPTSHNVLIPDANVGVGGTPTEKLHVFGNAKLTGTLFVNDIQGFSPLTITAPATNQKALVVKAIAGHSVNILEVQDELSAAMFAVNQGDGTVTITNQDFIVTGGDIQTTGVLSALSGVFTGLSVDEAISILGNGADQIRLLVKGSLAQATNTFEVRDSFDVERFAINPEDSVIVRITDMDLVMTFAGSGITTITGGNVTADGTITATGANADQIQLIVRGNSGQTANLQVWQDSASVTLASVGPTALLYLPDGADTAPAFSFLSDPDTGMYRTGANGLGFSTDATLRLTITTTEVESSLKYLAPNGSAASPSYSFSNDQSVGLLLNSNGLGFVTAGETRWQIDVNGHIVPITDNAFDIGIETTKRARHAWLSGNLNLDSDAGLLRLGAAQDVVLARDAADVLALVRSTNAQSLRVYQGISGADSSFLEISKPAGNVVAIIPKQTGAGVGAPYSLFISGKTNAVSPSNGITLDSSGSSMTIAGLTVDHKASVLDGSVSWTFVNTNGSQYAAFVVDATNFQLRMPGVARFNINNNGVSNEFTWRNSAGVTVLTLFPEAASPASLDMLGFITATPPSYSAAGSRQGMAADLTLGAGAGKNVSDTAFLAGVMGNIFGASLTKTGNYLGGVIGHYSITGAGASTYQKGAVLAGISDGSTDADGAVVAYIDGDSGAATTAGAAFKVRHNNSTLGNFFNFGLDLFDAAHDGFNAVSYLKGEIRLLTEAVIFTGSGAPTDGVSGTGAGFASKGSLYIDTSTGEAYLNTGTKASPTWKQITHA